MRSLPTDLGNIVAIKAKRTDLEREFLALTDVFSPRGLEIVDDLARLAEEENYLNSSRRKNMLITRRSQLTGKECTVDLPITQEQIDAWHSGTLIQNAFPNLTADQREFLKTGITEEEWTETFGDEE